MQADMTEIVVVFDRSGSMRDCLEDAQGGFNAFLDAQRKLPGRANLTLAQFDDVYEIVHKGVPIREVPPYVLVPRNTTAMQDAVAKTIVETGERLAALGESERPGLVVFVIVTDGKENASKEYEGAEGRERVRQMI